MDACVEKARKHRPTAIVLAMLLACWPCALALDPSLDISQYAHTAWTVHEGFFKGRIQSIAQTPDGYLWLGTEFGLLRFDGVRSVPWQSPTGQRLPGSYIWSLLAARDGTLWIGADRGLASWKDGKLTQYPPFTGEQVLALLEDRDGTIWVGGSAIGGARLCAIQRGGVQCYGEDGRLGTRVDSLCQDSGGSLWVGSDKGLWRWKPGPPQLYPIAEVHDLIESDNGALLIATSSGIRQLVGGKLHASPLPAAWHLLRDRNGDLWIAAQHLLHVHQGRVDEFAQSDGLSSDSISAFFEDREGNVWVGTANGLDRFRDLSVVTISAKRGLSEPYGVSSVLAARDGSVWAGTADGLCRWKNGQMTIYRGKDYRGKDSSHDREGVVSGRLVREIADSGLPGDGVESLLQDDRGRIWVSTHSGLAYFENGRFFHVNGVPGGNLYSIAGDIAGNLWVSHDQSLFHLVGDSVVERIPWASLGRNLAATLIADPRGGLWLGFRGGVTYFRDGQVGASFAAVDGLGDGRVNSLRLDRDGTLWAATEGGLSRIKDGRVATLTSKNRLPCDSVDWVMEDDAHFVWLNMACGLVRIARTELDSWVADSSRTVQATVFDSSDGVASHALYGGFSPHVTKDADGKLWLVPVGNGVSIIDPRHLPFNKLPPPVHIEQITADGKTYWQNLWGDASSRLRLPALSRDLAIDYTALSFVVPEKVRFRYKLEGQDKDWRELVNVRHVEYTNLAPRHYRFHVIAANNSGVWNEQGTSLDFSVAPAYWQTTWFRAACVAVFLAMLWGMYRLRVLQLAHEFNMTVDARVDERTRIARDLHDTLLQSLQALLLRFQSVDNLLPDRPLDAKQRLGSAIDEAAEAITEGRDAVQGLRSSATGTNDLAAALSALAGELAVNEGSGETPAFEMQLTGKPLDLHPILRDEVYRIAGEAMRNAFRHARAKRVEAEIRYDERQFRVSVRDDGRGIDPEVLSREEREGHFGLSGMQERARLLGGKLTVWSEADSGTEVELTIPGAIAYSGPSRRSWWFQRFGKEAETSEKMKS
ncbi:MAG TPA: two-component regulator propeller domain-containing protein [Silvibacterium sp.]|nr:two-component regulator propeller domain-containing protein [Silvibacterium sp.]